MNFIKKFTIFNLDTKNNPDIEEQMAKDQTFLTDKQIEKDIKKRHSVQKVGIELEMYSSMSIESTQEHINDNMQLDNWECVSDGSLYNFVEEIYTEQETPETTVFSDDYFRNIVGTDQSRSIMINFYQSIGARFEELYNIMSERLPDHYVNQISLDDLLNNNTAANQYFNNLMHIPEALAIAHSVNSTLNSVRLSSRTVSERINRHGVEARVISPVSMHQARHKLEEMYKMATDRSIRPVFKNPERGNTDHSEMSGENHGMAGIHFHFGLSQQINYSVLDLFRLVKNVSSRASEVEAKALRPHNRWCKKLDPIISEINAKIENLGSSGKKSDMIRPRWFKDSHRFSLDDPRYYGVNVTNIGYGKRNNGNKKFNTVEFRWGSSEMVADMESLTEYFDMLVDFIDTSFTGSKVMNWNGYTLKDISDPSRYGKNKWNNVIAVISPEGKLIGRLEMPDLCNSFVSKVPTEIELAYEESFINSPVPKFESISKRDLLSRIEKNKHIKSAYSKVFSSLKNDNNKNGINHLIKTMLKEKNLPGSYRHMIENRNEKKSHVIDIHKIKQKVEQSSEILDFEDVVLEFQNVMTSDMS